MMFIIVLITFLLIQFLFFRRSEKQKEGLKDIRIVFSTRDIYSKNKEFLNFLNNKLDYHCTISILTNYNYLEIVKKVGNKKIYIIEHKYCPKTNYFVSSTSVFDWLETIRISIENTQ